MTKAEFFAFCRRHDGKKPPVLLIDNEAQTYTPERWVLAKFQFEGKPYHKTLYCPYSGRQMKHMAKIQPALDAALAKFKRWLDEFYQGES